MNGLWVYEPPRNFYEVGEVHPVIVCRYDQLRIHASHADLRRVQNLTPGWAYTSYAGGRWYRAE